jgi:methionyl-tRNA formyltransferase
MKNILIITDNEVLLKRFVELVKSKAGLGAQYVFHYGYSPANKDFARRYGIADWIRPVDVKTEAGRLGERYAMIISLHCKQMFPTALVSQVKCLNVHPGLNPHNRGWFPQVFSILNGLPCGATIHEMDQHLDHGPVICQKEVRIESWDTSLTAYNRILDAEIELLQENLESILSGNYQTLQPMEGNVNRKSDFDALCRIDMTQQDSFENHINKLRALTHGDYLNAYFVDRDGAKVYLKLELRKKE